MPINNCISRCVVLIASSSGGCQPTVKVAAPKEPIIINLNIKLEADRQLRVEEKARQDVKKKQFF